MDEPLVQGEYSDYAMPSAERRAHPFPPVEMRFPASVDRFPCFHTCPAYEQKKRAIPGRIFLLADRYRLLVSYRSLATAQARELWKRDCWLTAA